MRAGSLGSPELQRALERRRGLRGSSGQRKPAPRARRSQRRRPQAGGAATRRLRALPDLFVDANDRRLPRALPRIADPSHHASTSNRGACMKCVLFYHAFTSCWNNGNAHFLRGYARELHALGHNVVIYEPVDGWSRMNAIREGGLQAMGEIPALFPGIDLRRYDAFLDLDEALGEADLVIVHEWNSPDLIADIAHRRAQGGSFTLLFHDTHHRAVTAPEELARF